MQFNLVIPKEKLYNITTLEVKAGVRYREDFTINGKKADETTKIPCKNEVTDYWCPIINVDTGVIINWTKGVVASIYSKICDDGTYSLITDNGEKILHIEDAYVPSCLCIGENGYGDYIIMEIDGEGKIKDWKFNRDSIDSFLEEDE